MSVPTDVYSETGARRVFACAVGWPGWCRAARTEDLALAALAAYAPRYAVVARDAGLAFGPPDAELSVVERVKGNATTDFGAPDAAIESDSMPLSPAEAERTVAIIAASWRAFDRVLLRAPQELAKGPRGGGRDRGAIAQHVVSAESAYGRTIGLRLREPPPGNGDAVRATRDAICAAILGGLASPDVVRSRWPLRYAARRIAWHVLDHVWEIEDRGGLTPELAWAE